MPGHRDRRPRAANRRLSIANDSRPALSPEPPKHLSSRTDLATALSLLQRFELMADSMPARMAYHEYDGLRCAYANQAQTATFGHSRRSIVGLGLAEVIGADALRQIEPHIERMFAVRQMVSYTRTVQDAAGTAHPFEVNLVPYLGDDADAAAPPHGAFVLINDITRYHDAQQALRDGKERLRRFMEPASRASPSTATGWSPTSMRQCSRCWATGARTCWAGR